MMPARTLVAVVLAAGLGLGLAAAPAAAEDVVTYDARGRGDAAAADPRTAALDAAFAVAVTEAVADLAGPGARQKAAEVDREIIRRARRFVASFQVKSQASDGGALELEVAVRVDLDKVRARLGELGVALRPRPAEPPPTPARGKRTATVLLRVTGVGRPSATFGARAVGDVPGAERLVEALAAAGYVAVPASAAGPPPDADGDLPLDDVSARALAGDVRADVAVIGNIAVGAVAPVRGVPLRAAPAEAHLRVIEVKTGALLDEVRVSSGAWGSTEQVPGVAAEAAATAVAAAALAPRRPRATAGGPDLVAGHGVTVRVRGERPWAVAAAIRARLVGAPGVSRVTWAGVGAGQIVLGVDGVGADKVAGQIKTTDGISARVDVDGEVVEVVPEGS